MYLYKNNKGVFGKLNQLNATSSEVGLVFNDIAISLGKSGNVQRFESGAWTEIYANGDLASTEGNGIFVDSRGYIFICFDADNTDLYRSTDNGLTFTSTLTAPSGDKFRMVTEDNKGNLYTGGYSGQSAPRTPSLFKSIDGGETWTSIYSNLANTYARHIHNVYYDKYRDLLFVAGGDDGDTADVQYSSDYGETFTSWSSSIQTTGIACDADYIYLASDTSLDRSIYRAKNVGGTITKVFTPIESTAADNGFIWEIIIDDDGRIIAPYCQAATVARMYVSENQGESWELVKETSGATVNKNKFAYYRSAVSPYSSYKWNKIHCSGDTSATVYAWQIMSKTQSINVDYINGSDVGDGISVAKKEIFDYEPLQELSSVSLKADYPSSVGLYKLPSLDGGLLYGFTGTQLAGDSESSTDFESGAGGFTALNLGGGVANISATTNPRSGTKHLNADLSAGAGTASAFVIDNQFSASTSQGDEIWHKGYIQVNSALTADIVICGIRQGGIEYFVILDQSDSNKVYATLYDTVNDTRTYVQNPNESGVTLNNDGAYHKVKARIKAHDTKGRITVWIDDVCAIDVIGIKTTDTANAKLLNDPFFGVRSTQLSMNVDWDDIEITINRDPDIPVNSSALLLGSNQKARSIKQTSSILEISGTDNAMECCVCDNPTVVPYLLSGVRSECHNGYFKGGSAAIVNNSFTGAVYNSVFSGQSGQAITETQICATAGNVFDGSLVATPDSTDVNGSYPVDAEYRPSSIVNGVTKRLIYDTRNIIFSSPPNIGVYEYKAKFVSLPRKPRL